MVAIPANLLAEMLQLRIALSVALIPGGPVAAIQASLYSLHGISSRSLYADVAQRANTGGELLPGTPGTLVKRAGTGHEYWYRSYSPAPRKRSEQFVGTAGNSAAFEAMQSRIADSEWTVKQVTALAKLGYQVADKSVASVLVELRNRRIFEAGMVVVGTLAFLSWLNEYGAMAATAAAQDVELARRQTLKLATPVSFLSAMHATQLPFALIPGVPAKNPPTSVKLPGAEGRRVEVSRPRSPAGRHRRACRNSTGMRKPFPFYDYLLEGSRAAGALAGGHCVPILLPDVARMIWYDLHSSTRRSKDPDKAEKDLVQAATLAAIVIEQQSVLLRESYREAPRELRNAAHSRLPRLEKLLAEHPRARDEFRKLR